MYNILDQLKDAKAILVDNDFTCLKLVVIEDSDTHFVNVEYRDHDDSQILLVFTKEAFRNHTTNTETGAITIVDNFDDVIELRLLTPTPFLL